VLGLRTDDHIPGAQKMTKMIHSYGAKCSFALGHTGAILARMVIGRKIPAEFPEFHRIFAPTGTRDPFTGFMTHTMEKMKSGT
jgi:2,4-dienoyl-CoA reductase-like NADH-dependent reductase (Old Yellow Enzyme family)